MPPISGFGPVVGSHFDRRLAGIGHGRGRCRCKDQIDLLVDLIVDRLERDDASLTDRGRTRPVTRRPPCPRRVDIEHGLETRHVAQFAKLGDGRREPLVRDRSKWRPVSGTSAER